MVSGQILDDSRAPLEGASVVIGGVEHRTDAEGRFTVEGHPPDALLLVKRPGFARVTVPPTRAALEVVLKPQMIKAAYLTYFGIGHKEIRGRVLELAARTELNAVVIDVKGDRGWIVYRTEVPEALAVGAQGPATLKEFDGLMADLKARGSPVKNADLESENKALRQRVEGARTRVHDLMQRLTFLEEQARDNGAHK